MLTTIEGQNPGAKSDAEIVVFSHLFQNWAKTSTH